MSNDESLIQFPCFFPLKVFGRNELEFQTAVDVIVQKHLPHIGKGAISKRLSRGDKYLAITVSFIAQSKAQLDAIYQDLNDHESVLMTL